MDLRCFTTKCEFFETVYWYTVFDSGAIMAAMTENSVSARPGFRVTLDPGEVYEYAGVWCKTRPAVTVHGEYSLLSRQEIISFDRFVQYEQSDLDWALPLGMCRVSRVPYRVGDSACIEMFCTGLFGALICIASHGVDLSGPTVMTTVRFMLIT